MPSTTAELRVPSMVGTHSVTIPSLIEEMFDEIPDLVVSDTRQNGRFQAKAPASRRDIERTAAYKCIECLNFFKRAAHVGRIEVNGRAAKGKKIVFGHGIWYFGFRLSAVGFCFMF
jgi:hypothetical protein